jgi:N-methylhydantoinase A
MLTAALALERSGPVDSGGITGSEADVLIQGTLDDARHSGWTERDLAGAHRSWFADVRYRGQGHELRVALGGPPEGSEEVETAFHDAYERRFGYVDRSAPVELVNLRLRLSSPADQIPIVGREGVSRPAEGESVEVGGASALLLRRDRLGAGMRFFGAAVVIQDDATTYVPAGWRATVDPFANLLLEPAP